MSILSGPMWASAPTRCGGRGHQPFYMFKEAVSMYQPLADELRPVELDEVYGQRHILGPGGLLRRIIESGSVPNMIFYGPSGVGKTTVANIIAKNTQRKL